MNNVIKNLLDNNADSALADWASFVQHMAPYTSNRTGIETTQFEQRIAYPVDRMCTFWWQQTYGNVEQPGTKSPSGKSEYSPFAREQMLSAQLGEMLDRLTAEGHDTESIERDMGFVNLRIRLHEAQLWLDYCRTNLTAWMSAYKELNSNDFVYQAYDERPRVAREVTPTTATAKLLAMLPKFS